MKLCQALIEERPREQFRAFYSEQFAKMAMGTHKNIKILTLLESLCVESLYTNVPYKDLGS